MTVLAILFAVLGFLIFPSNAYAGFTFTSSQTSITQDQEINTSVILSLQGQNNKTYYLEGAFKKEGSSNYFGLTWNDSSWVHYTASNFTTIKSITTDQNGEWSGMVKVKIDRDSNLFSGDGVYILRLKRFTMAGSYYWADNSIAITFISPPSPAPSPASTPSPTLSPTSTPTPTPSPTPKPTSSFIISNIPPQINSDQSFEVSVNLTLPNNKNADYFLSGAFKKVDNTRYFGLTKVNSNWVQYGSSNYLNQYKITTNDNGNWAGTLEVKPDIKDSDYKGSGNYIFSIGRYTSAGSGPTWSNETTIKINHENTVISNNLSTSQSTSNITPTVTPQSTIVKSPTTKPTYLVKNSYQVASVAAATISAKTVTDKSKVEVKSQKQKNPMVWIGSILIFAGIGTMGYIYLTKNAKIHF